jgi:hypothetical protein
MLNKSEFVGKRILTLFKKAGYKDKKLKMTDNVFCLLMVYFTAQLLSQFCDSLYLVSIIL